MNEPPVIELEHSEIAHAAITGLMRHLQNLRKGRKHAYGASAENGWAMHIEGACGELALAKHFGCYYAGVGIFRGADVCGTEQCRTTTHPDGRLPIHPKDANDARFWLVTGCDGTYTIRGWIMGRDAKRREWWADPQKTGRFAYWVPQSELIFTDAGKE